MSKGKRYKKSEKRYSTFFLFYAVVAVLSFASFTFSRYITTANVDDVAISVAKFNVKVNGQYIGADTPFYLQLSQNTNTYNNKIAPDVQNGHFEIVIDPTSTEVSLEYEFTFNVANIDQNVHLVKYTVNDGEEQNIVDNMIKGEILLPDNTKGFEEKDTIIIKVYWEWNEDIVNPTIGNNNISVISVVKQKIN